MTHIVDINIDDSGLPDPSVEMEQERRVAIFDLLEKNSFVLTARDKGAPPTGPFKLTLAIRGQRLVFDLRSEAGKPLTEFHLSFGPFRQVVKDYFMICESYFDAVKKLGPGQIETIDMARRGIHNEGARVLIERLEGKAVIDTDTARRLFTLVCVLRRGG